MGMMGVLSGVGSGLNQGTNNLLNFYMWKKGQEAQAQQQYIASLLQSALIDSQSRKYSAEAAEREEKAAQDRQMREQFQQLISSGNINLESATNLLAQYDPKQAVSMMASRQGLEDKFANALAVQDAKNRSAMEVQDAKNEAQLQAKLQDLENKLALLQNAPPKRTLKGLEKGTSKVVYEDKDSPTGLVYADGSPYKGGQLVGLTEPAPFFQYVGQAPGGGPGITFSSRGNEFSTVPIPGGGQITPKVEAPMSAKALEDLTGCLNSWRSLDRMEGFVKDTPNAPYLGYGRLAAAKVGRDPMAQQFMAEKDQYRLSAQSLIKGIPSNYDVQTVLATIPGWGEARSTNMAKIKAARDIIRTLTTNAIAYYKYLNYPIPKAFLEKFKAMGVDPDAVGAWEINVDQLSNAVREELKARGEQQ